MSSQTVQGPSIPGRLVTEQAALFTASQVIDAVPTSEGLGKSRLLLAGRCSWSSCMFILAFIQRQQCVKRKSVQHSACVAPTCFRCGSHQPISRNIQCHKHTSFGMHHSQMCHICSSYAVQALSSSRSYNQHCSIFVKQQQQNSNTSHGLP